MAIFITGDTHGDFTRFKKKIFYEQAELSKEDCVIICGDFGGIWDGSAEERHWLDWLEARPSLRWAGPAVTTLTLASWNRTFLCLRKNARDWTPVGHCTG